MNYLIISVNTPTQAMKVKRLLYSAGIMGELIKTKDDVNAGCTHGVKIHEKHFYDAALLLRNSNVIYTVKRTNI